MRITRPRRLVSTRPRPPSASLANRPARPTTEQTDQGEQRIIPAAERVSDREVAERRGAEPLKPSEEQKGVDGLELFDADARPGAQRDIFEEPPPRESEAAPTPEQAPAPAGVSNSGERGIDTSRRRAAGTSIPDWQLTEGEFVTRRVGPNWVVARKNRERGIDPEAVRITPKQYRQLQEEHKRTILEAARARKDVPEIAHHGYPDEFRQEVAAVQKTKPDDEGKLSLGRGPFTPDAREARRFVRQLDDFVRGLLRGLAPLRIGRTPAVYLALGARDLPLVISRSVVRKVAIKKHDIHTDTLARLPELMVDPVMVLASATVPGDFVAVIDATDQRGAPLIASIRVSNTEATVNAITSIHDRKKEWFQRQIDANRLLYINKAKSADWSHRVIGTGLQLPGRGPIQRSDAVGGKVLSEDDIVKDSGERLSLGRQDASPFADARRARLLPILRKRLDDIGLKNVALKLPDIITSMADGKATPAEGRYLRGLIEIAMAGKTDKRHTLDHEIIHALNDMGVFKPAEWRDAEKGGARRYRAHGRCR